MNLFDTALGETTMGAAESAGCQRITTVHPRTKGPTMNRTAQRTLVIFATPLLLAPLAGLYATDARGPATSRTSFSSLPMISISNLGKARNSPRNLQNYA